MPRSRPKPTSYLIPGDLLREIKSIRPLRLFINKQKKKGNADNPFTLRVKFCKLPPEKQAKFLQKSVDRYIELLDERDIDENIQIKCKLFDYLLMKGEQKKYFQSINAPIKPPGTAIPYYTQYIKQEMDDDIEWKSLSIAEKKNYKKMRKEAKFQYSAQVRNFANDLPERLRTDYLSFAEPKRQKNDNTSLMNDYIEPEPIRQRRKSLTALPDSLQTTSSTDDVPTKLTRKQLYALHKLMPSTLYYENDVSNDEKPTFTRTMTKNAYVRSLYIQLNDDERLQYINKSIKKWNEFLHSNPNIIENQIPTLHLLLARNEDIVLYFYSIGLPQRPPINSYLLYHLGKDDSASSEAWTNLSQKERNEYSQQLVELKTEYYQNLVQFIEQNLTTDYMRNEFLRNVKYAVKDYELAVKNEIIDINSATWKFLEGYKKKMGMNNVMNQFNQIKQRLLATNLSNEQKNLVEELTELLYKSIDEK